MITIITLSLLPALISLIVDPYHIFHKPVFEKHGFDDGHLFFHVAGMINNYLDDPDENYTAVVIGASTASGYTQDLFEKTLKWGKTLNLSISGSNAQHHCIIAKQVLGNHKNIKHIFIDISFHYAQPDYNIEALDDPASGEPMPLYLYNNSRIDDLKYIFNITTLYTSIKILSGNMEEFGMGIENDGIWTKIPELDKIFKNYSSKKNVDETIIPSLKKIKRRSLSKQEIDNINFDAIDKRLSPTLMPYCNTEMDIVLNISPKSRVSFSRYSESEDFYREFYMRRHLVNTFQSCRNIRIFSFDNIDSITADMRNYMDDVHFHPKIHEYILNSISRNENIISPDNIDIYESNLLEKINSYPEELIEKYDQE